MLAALYNNLIGNNTVSARYFFFTFPEVGISQASMQKWSLNVPLCCLTHFSKCVFIEKLQILFLTTQELTTNIKI